MSKMFTLISRSRTCTLTHGTRDCRRRHNKRKAADVDSLGDAVVDPDGGQILGDEPLLAVTFDDAALQNKRGQLAEKLTDQSGYRKDKLLCSCIRKPSKK